MRVEFAGGKLVSVKPAGVPAGTSIAVHDIFYCVPARRKFLKSETTELGHIASLVTHYALAHPEKQFLLKTPSQEIVNVAPVERLADRVYQLFGQASAGGIAGNSGGEGPVRASITEAGLDADERVGEDSRHWIYFASGSAARQSKWDLHFCESAAGAGPFVAARDYRGLSKYYAGRRFSCGAAVRRFAVPGSGRERAPRQKWRCGFGIRSWCTILRATRFATRWVRCVRLLGFSRGCRPAAQTSRLGMPFGANGGAGTGISEGQGDAAAHTAGHAEWGAQAAAAGVGRVAAGPPRAVIPTSFSSGAALEEGFELSGAPLQPLEQRLQFGAQRGTEFVAPFPGMAADAAGNATAAAPAAFGSLPGAIERGGVCRGRKRSRT